MLKCYQNRNFSWNNAVMRIPFCAISQVVVVEGQRTLTNKRNLAHALKVLNYVFKYVRVRLWGSIARAHTHNDILTKQPSQ